MRQIFRSAYKVLITYALVLNCYAGDSYAEREDVLTFIENFSSKYEYPKSDLIELIKGVEKQVKVIEAIQRPAEKKKNWEEYRAIFVTSKRIEKGMQFWTDNAQTLAAAERKFGVPPEIIVAIIGVETFYGTYEGKFRVLDSLVTLGFDYPPRQKFFRSELEQFLLLTQEEGFDASVIKGSYAGAMGKSQFISSSYRRYAIDFDGDGQRDLWNSSEDIIGSVANYFSEHGWKEGEPITTPVTVFGDRYSNLLNKGIRPAALVSDLPNYDVKIDINEYSQKKVALLELKNHNSTEYWVGFDNFYVITRYNHSHMYAMAVYQLSQQIKQNITDYIAQN